MSKKDLKSNPIKRIGIIGANPLLGATKEMLKADTTKKTISSEELEIVEPNRGDTPLPAIQGDPVNRFMREMREGDLPAEAEGRTLYIFHRETGQRMEHSLELIMKNRKFAFQVWAKTYEFALSEFVRRTKWKKRMGKNTPCPLPEIKD